MNDKLLKKIDEFMGDLAQVSNQPSEKKRQELSNKIVGYIRGGFGDKRLEDYKKMFAFNKSGLTSIGIFNKKIWAMRNFLLSLKEELETKELFGIEKDETNIDAVREKAEASKTRAEKKLESSETEVERRKNVAEFKYWGFAIELIDTVRRELKEFRQIQEGLLSEIKGLREDIKSLKENKS